MAKYKRRNDGMVPFFGKLVGFELIRFADHYQFDADGRLVEHVDKLYRPGECWVELR
jgi:hypothetical protein